MELTDKEKQFYRDLENLRLKYKLGDIPKITNIERQILEFCHSRNMMEFLREEFEKHPIVLDENGGLVGKNPFINEDKAGYNGYVAPSNNGGYKGYENVNNGEKWTLDI